MIFLTSLCLITSFSSRCKILIPLVFLKILRASFKPDLIFFWNVYLAWVTSYNKFCFGPHSGKKHFHLGCVAFWASSRITKALLRVLPLINARGEI